MAEELKSRRDALERNAQAEAGEHQAVDGVVQKTREEDTHKAREIADRKARDQTRKAGHQEEPDVDPAWEA